MQRPSLFGKDGQSRAIDFVLCGWGVQLLLSLCKDRHTRVGERPCVCWDVQSLLSLLLGDWEVCAESVRFVCLGCAASSLSVQGWTSSEENATLRVGVQRLLQSV